MFAAVEAVRTRPVVGHSEVTAQRQTGRVNFWSDLLSLALMT
jgi:hypothetical protein